MTNLEKHPIQTLKKIADKLPHDAEFEFSIYEHAPQSILDTRSIFTMKSSELSTDFILEIVSNLAETEELALHSRIRSGKKLLHIPMIDFCSQSNEINENSNLIKNILPKKISRELEIYKSGNSYHGYSLTLISSKEWIDFMGRLLLLNLPQKSRITDTRWIGHRLMAGYSSLRWSNNTNIYLMTPQFEKNFT